MRGIAILTAIFALLSAGPALAHIEVFPTSAPVGEAQTFTIRVPSEGRDTTGIRMTFPDNISVFSFRPPGSGFAVEPLRGANGELNGVRYRGGSFGPDTYEEFEVIATPQEPGAAIWRVEQQLADGTTVLWTGPPESEGESAGEPSEGEPGPAAAIEITAEPVAEPGIGPGSSGDADAAMWLALIAAGLAAGALIVGGLLWASRPMELPKDD
ncbi:MAG: DUF1775 domain-containing protein [Thermoleophilia bacterium]|nr:DUF1775 domain-containing protein [Thermoleophilia bacterium]MDH3724540.1 DUF1775 domain-containing protein [Thermoleophilia bacterium]